MNITVACPQCESDVEFDVCKDNNYGADADGNRGGVAYFSDFDLQTCDCELSETEVDELSDRSIEAFDELNNF